MEKNKIGFSLIEVVIATSIITITVFGVYKLIGENNKIITNSSNYLQVNSLFPVLEECLEYFTFSHFTLPINTIYTFDLGGSGALDECKILTNGVVIIDNIDYILKSKITNKTLEYIDWELQIKSENTKTMTGFYRQKK